MIVAGVLGFPIEHSLSPILHEAAYRALGLDNWEYIRIPCTAEELPGVVSSSSADIRGYSVTMPGKEAALEFADEVSERARFVQSANTIYRKGDVWAADCTDVDGAAASIEASEFTGGNVLLAGAGGTSRPYIAALDPTRVTKLFVASRDRERSAATLDLAKQHGLDVEWLDLMDSSKVAECASVGELVISTLPASGAVDYAHNLARCGRMIDVAYSPWPSPIAQAASPQAPVVSGATMLLYQAIRQVELFTGLQSDKCFSAMADALGDVFSGPLYRRSSTI